MEIDRARAQSVGMQSRDVAQNVLVSLSSSFQTAPALAGSEKWRGVLRRRAGTAVSPWILIRRSKHTDQRQHAGARPQILGNLVTTSTTARPAEGRTTPRNP